MIFFLSAPENIVILFNALTPLPVSLHVYMCYVMFNFKVTVSSNAKQLNLTPLPSPVLINLHCRGVAKGGYRGGGGTPNNLLVSTV